MRQLFKLLIFFALLTNSFLSFAQFPIAGFTLPTDTVCVGESFNPTNKSNNGAQYNWDFCGGDLLGIPKLDFLSYYDPNSNGNVANWGTSIHFLYDKNYSTWIAYTTASGGRLIKQLFNRNLEPLGALTYNNFNTDWSNIMDFSFTEISGHYYGLGVGTTKYGQVFLMDLGTDLMHEVPKIKSLLPQSQGFPSTNLPRGVKIVKDMDSIFAFISNDNRDSLTVLSFGKTLTGSYSVKTIPLNNPSFNPNLSCYNSDYVKIDDKWYGFIGSMNYSLIRLEFGKSLWSKPKVTYVTDVAFTPDCKLLNEKGSWCLFTRSMYGSDSCNYYRYNFGKDITNMHPVKKLIANIPINQWSLHLEHVKDGSKNCIFVVTNDNSSQLLRLTFPDTCFSSNPIDTTMNPASIIYNKQVTKPQKEYVNLQVLDSKGNVSFKTDSITIFPALNINFLPDSSVSKYKVSGDTLSFCYDTVRFNPLIIDTNQITLSYSWDFGDGTSIVTMINPVHVYKNPGKYKVTLIISSSIYRCPGVISKTVYINRAYPIFSVNEGFVTPPLKFIDLTQDPNHAIKTWNWDFGDKKISNIQNPIHIYDTAGDYTIKYSVQVRECISSVVSRKISYIPRPNINFQAINNCRYATTSFNNKTVLLAKNDSIKVYTWSFGDGSSSSQKNPTHHYADTGNYMVKLKVLSYRNYADSLTIPVRIYTKAKPNFTNPSLVCVNNGALFTDKSLLIKDTITAWKWYFGDGDSSSLTNPTHSYKTFGIKNVMLITKTGLYCDSSIIQTINVTESPIPGYISGISCRKSAIQFTDTSKTPLGTTLKTWSWNFGDTTALVKTQSPKHTYNYARKYPLTLTVTNNIGCVGTLIDSIKINPLPIANFSPLQGCDNSAVPFSNSTVTLVKNSISSLKWTFGDALSGLNNYAYTANPTHFYSNSGNYSIKLFVTTINSCVDSITQIVRIKKSPKADFDFISDCFGNNISFSDASSVKDSSKFIAWNWNFGDGITSALRNPNHTYIQLDTFPVSMIVKTVEGCYDTITKNVIAQTKQGYASFSGNDLCLNKPYQFIDSSYAFNTTIATWQWSLSNNKVTDSIFSRTKSGLLIAKDTGIALVTLNVKTKEGCSALLTRTIKIHDIPHPSFFLTPMFGAPPLLIRATSTSTGADNLIWNFNDGDLASAQNKHVYQQLGIYPIKLIATSKYGCADSLTKQIKVMTPKLDIAIESLSTKTLNNSISITATIINIGTRTVDSIFLFAKLSNGSTIKELWIGSLPSATTLNYTFTAAFEIPENINPEYVCINLTHPSGEPDDSPENNTQCTPLHNQYIVINPYPNPTKDLLNIEYISPYSEQVDISLYESTGKYMGTIYTGLSLKGFNTIQYNTSRLAQGKYTYTVRFSNNTIGKQFDVAR